jgi:hypothetical protein
MMLREEHRLRVFKNRVLKMIFIPKKEKGQEGKYNKNDPMRMRWAGHVARMGDERNTYKLLVGTPGGKRPIERSRRRWVDNIMMVLGETGLGWYGLD